MENIMKMIREYAFLSNFFPCSVTAWGIEFPSVEHAYVACKTTDMAQKRHIARIPTAGKAKRYGRTSITLRPEWDERKVEFMAELLRRKFQDPDLASRLISVEEPIVEDNHWGDTFWGVCNGIGENWLGRLLTEIRRDLINERR